MNPVALTALYAIILMVVTGQLEVTRRAQGASGLTVYRATLTTYGAVFVIAMVVAAFVMEVIP